MPVREGVGANSVDELAKDNNGMAIEPRTFSRNLPYLRLPRPLFPLP